MPPWSDIRTQAQSLVATRQYVTFLDIIPLQRLAQTMVHLPEATVVALIDLYDAPATTLGAKDLLAEVLRNYNNRKTFQRALAKKILTAAHHGQTVRLQPGDDAFITLVPAAGQTWLLTSKTETAVACLTVTELPRLNHREQRFIVTAHAPGHGQLDGQHIPQQMPPGPSKAPNKKAMPRPWQPATRRHWQLTFIIEAPTDST